MPIDFIKGVHTNIDVHTLLKNNKLHFKSDYSHRTSEVYPVKVAKYKGLKFTIIGKYLKIEGSLHKFKNNGKQNHDDFTYSDLVKVINELEELLQIDCSLVSLENVEFGVNLLMEWESSLILQHLISYSTTEFRNAAIKSGTYKTAILDDFQPKVYDKAVQYSLLYNLLRLEIHVNKMRYVQSTGIKTLADLKNKTKLMLLRLLLIEVWEKIFLFDWTIHKEKGKQAIGVEQFYQMQQFSFWKGLNNKQRYKQRNKYKTKLVVPFSQNVHEQITKKIFEKFDFLINN